MSDFKLVNGQKLINPLLRLYYRRAMVHTFTNVCKSNACKFTNIWHENQTRSARNAPTHPRCGSTSFLTAGVSSTSLGEITKAAGVTRGAIYWHFKDKSDLFSEIWELSESNIGELELEYQAKFSAIQFSVLREILIHVLESTVTEERRRLLMEIIFHKCEFVGEMAVVQQAQRNLCLESYDRIEQTLKHCIEAKMLPADLMTRRAAIIMRGYISGLMENWLFAPQSLILKRSPRLRRHLTGDVSPVPHAS